MYIEISLLFLIFHHIRQIGIVNNFECNATEHLKRPILVNYGHDNLNQYTYLVFITTWLLLSVIIYVTNSQ